MEHYKLFILRQIVSCLETKNHPLRYLWLAEYYAIWPVFSSDFEYYDHWIIQDSVTNNYGE